VTDRGRDPKNETNRPHCKQYFETNKEAAYAVQTVRSIRKDQRAIKGMLARLAFVATLTDTNEDTPLGTNPEWRKP
jgi:hypothetical protein